MEKDDSLIFHSTQNICDTEMNVYKRVKGFEDFKKVYIFFDGNFPKNYIQMCSSTLPLRLYPNAKFVIKCNTKNYATVKYFKHIYKDRLLDFVDDDEIHLKKHFLDSDGMFALWIGNTKYSNNLTFNEIQFHNALNNFPNHVFLYFNDIGLPSYRDLYEVITERMDDFPGYLEKQKISNPLLFYKQFERKENKITLAFTNNILDKKPWWNDKLNKVKTTQVKLEILSDIIIYDFEFDKQKMIDNYVDKGFKKGGWVGTCFTERIELISRVFKNKIDGLDLEFRGVDSDKIDSEYASLKGRIGSEKVEEFYKTKSFGVYIARGKEIALAGQSLYEPILYNMPVFILHEIDKKHKIFNNIEECYFVDAEDLKNKIDTIDFKELYIKQVNSLYEKM